MLRLNRYRHSVRSKLLYPSHFALAIGLILVCTAGGAQAQAVVGDLLVVEISAGSIVNIRNGGGFTRGIAEFAGFAGTITTQNSKGQPLVELGVTTTGEGIVQTQNGKGQTLVEMNTRKSGPGAVVTYDPRSIEARGVYTTRP